MNMSLETIKNTIQQYSHIEVTSVRKVKTTRGIMYVVNEAYNYTPQAVYQMYQDLQNRNKVSAQNDIRKSKKSNMAYWDSIDDLAETFVEQFLACACVNNPKALQYQVDTTTLGKEVVEFLLGQLQEEGLDTDKLYPYVNENY